MIEFLVDDKNYNQRLDKYLLKILTNKSLIYKLLRKKIIKLNNSRAKGNEILKYKDIIKIYVSDIFFEKFKLIKNKNKNKIKTNKKITVLYEDEDILICNKDKFILSHSDKTGRESFLDILNNYLNSNNAVICNRLDFNTSGIILCAKNFLAAQELNKIIFNHNVDKYYFSIVYGCFDKKSYSLNNYCVKDNKKNILTISEDNKQKEILTKFNVISSNKNFSLIKINLITGKSHQIRSHLSYINHPLIGDIKYGNEKLNLYLKKKFKLKNYLLHAYKIKFNFKNHDYNLLKKLDNLEVKSNIPLEFNYIKNKLNL